MIDEELKKLIEERISKECEFLGYGILKNSIWFIGMEEGFDDSGKQGNWKENLKKRFEATNKKEVVDIYNDMEGVTDHTKWFENPEKLKKKPSLQTTYKELVRILLIIKGDADEKIIDRDIIRKFQKDDLGKTDKKELPEHCLLELMPLPSPSTRKWIYKEFAISSLENRQDYEEKFTSLRASLYNKKFEEYNPKVVIFYGTSLLKYWQNIVGEDNLIEINNKDIKKSKIYASRDGKYIVIPHPNSRGIETKERISIGKAIKEKINSLL